MVEQLQGSLIKVENFQKLLELKKDLIGIDNLVVPGRVSLNSVYIPNIAFIAFLTHDALFFFRSSSG